MSLLKKLQSTATLEVASTARANKDNVGTVIFTPTEGCIRINPIMAAYLGINYQNILDSTDAFDKVTKTRSKGTHPGVYATIVGMETAKGTLILFTLGDPNDAGVPSFKLASPTNTPHSSLQFSSNYLWERYGGKKAKVMTYLCPIESAIAAFDENNEPVTIAQLVADGEVEITLHKDGSFKAAKWSANSHDNEVGSNVEMMFPLDDATARVEESTERKASDSADSADKVEKAPKAPKAPATPAADLNNTDFGL